MGQSTFQYSAAKDWNNLPTLMRRISDLSLLNEQFFSFYVTKMDTVTNARFYDSFL